MITPAAEVKIMSRCTPTYNLRLHAMGLHVRGNAYALGADAQQEVKLCAASSTKTLL